MQNIDDIEINEIKHIFKDIADELHFINQELKHVNNGQFEIYNVLSSINKNLDRLADESNCISYSLSDLAEQNSKESDE